MTELELTFDTTTAVSYWDADGIVPTSATVTLSKPDGTAVSAPTVTLPSLSTTLAAGSTASTLILASVTGLARGDHFRVTTDGQDYVVQALTVNGTTKTVGLVAALPVTPTTGDAVKALKMTATVAAVGLAGIGGNYRLTWSYTDGTNPRQVGIPCAVVRWPWTPPCGPSDVAEILIEMKTTWAEARCQDVADKVNDKIRAKLAQTGKRPSLYLSSLVFADVARSGIRYELALRGVAHGGQVLEAQRETRFAFEDGLTSVITGLSAYDSNADGQIDATEARPHWVAKVRR